MILRPASFDSPRRPPRPAFTLLEILLVLVILVIVAAMAWPAVIRSMGDYRLKSAAETVRSELAATRNRAVDTGLMYQFLYEPGGRRFVSIPFERETSPDDAQRLMITTKAAIDDLPRSSGMLPEGLAFPRETLIDFSLQKLPRELFAGLPDGDSLASLRWAEPVLFHTDGSAEGPNLDLADMEKRLLVTLEVRNLTGSVAIGTVTREETP